jgi:hypothetical protein
MKIKYEYKKEKCKRCKELEQLRKKKCTCKQNYQIQVDVRETTL